VNWALLAELSENIAPGVLADLLGQVVENAALACERLTALPAGSPALAAEAHALRGASGAFGLGAVSALAREIEAAAGREGNEDVSGTIGRLAAAVAATRAELRVAASSPAERPARRRLEPAPFHNGGSTLRKCRALVTAP
jgi:HPt (histidine-containing phosphotransfer) domain-containing protein